MPGAILKSIGSCVWLGGRRASWQGMRGMRSQSQVVGDFLNELFQAWPREIPNPRPDPRDDTERPSFRALLHFEWVKN